MAIIISPGLSCVGGAAVIFELKAALKAQGWTVPQSSDGTTYNPAGDQITVPGAGAGGMNNASAWFVIQQPVSGRQFMFQRHPAVDFFWWVAFSTASQFTGGAPNATTPPTAADAQNLLGTGTASTAQLFNVATFRTSILVDSAAPYGFCLFTNIQATTTFNNLIMMDFMQASTFNAADAEPYVLMVAGPTNPVYSGVSNAAASITNQAGNDYMLRGWYKYGLAGAAFQGWAFQPWFSPSVADYFNRTGTNAYNGKDDLYPVVYGHEGVNGGMKGVSSWLQAMGTQRASQDTLNLSASRDLIVIGPGMATNWDGSVPVV
jgi:hypothetical protein